jgi:hypothetical protein
MPGTSITCRATDVKTNGGCHLLTNAKDFRIWKLIIWSEAHGICWSNCNSLDLYSGDLCSNLDTGYQDWGFSWYFSVPPSKFQDTTCLSHDYFLLNPFQFIFESCVAPIPIAELNNIQEWKLSAIYNKKRTWQTKVIFRTFPMQESWHNPFWIKWQMYFWSLNIKNRQ